MSFTIDVRRGQVFEGSSVAHLSPRERELITAIAIHTDPMTPEQLGALLYPESDWLESRASIKATVHRVRRRLAPDAIVYHAGTYRLGSSVRNDRHDPAALLLNMRCANSALLPSQIERLLAVSRSLRAEPAAELMRFEWFACRWGDFRRQGREMAIIIAEWYLRHGQLTSARNVASELTYDDRCDEEAWEILIRAHLARGDRGAAYREYRTYRDLVENELGVEPSEQVASLFALQGGGFPLRRPA